MVKKSRWWDTWDSVQSNKIKENETVKEFVSIFDRLYNQIPTDYHPTTSLVHLLYMNSFEGKLGYILKDTYPTSLVEAKKFSIDIEENLLDAKIETFQYPRNKT
jgi:hypothetical protein